MGYWLNFSFKILFYEDLGEKSPKFFPAEPFFRALQIKCLSNRSYLKETSPALKKYWLSALNGPTDSRFPKEIS